MGIDPPSASRMPPTRAPTAKSTLSSGTTTGVDIGAHREPVADLAVTPDARVVSVGSGGTAHVWDPLTPPAAARTVRTASRDLSAVTVSPDGRRFVTASRNNGVLQVWNLPPAPGA